MNFETIFRDPLRFPVFFFVVDRNRSKSIRRAHVSHSASDPYSSFTRYDVFPVPLEKRIVAAGNEKRLNRQGHVSNFDESLIKSQTLERAVEGNRVR